MKTTIKKIFSLLLCLSMVATVIPFAGITTASADPLPFKIELKVYKCANPTAPTALGDELTSGATIKTGDSILVGVEYSNLSTLTTYGIERFTAEIAYDCEKFTPKYAQKEPAATETTSIAESASSPMKPAYRNALKNNELITSVVADETYSINNCADKPGTGTTRYAYASFASQAGYVDANTVLKDDHAALIYFSFTAKEDTEVPASFAFNETGSFNVFGYYTEASYNSPQVTLTTYDSYKSTAKMEAWTPFEINIGTQLPAAVDWDETSKTKIANATADVTADSDDNTAAKLKAKLDDLTGLKVVDEDGNSYDVASAVWTTEDAYDAKGKTYTYTATVTKATGAQVNTAAFKPEAKIKVTPVTLDLNNTFEDKTVTVGTSATFENFGIPTSGDAKAGDKRFHYDITWSPAAATAVDTSAANSTGVEFTTTASSFAWKDNQNENAPLSELPAWVTIPENGLVKSITIKVKDKDKATAWTTAAATTLAGFADKKDIDADSASNTADALKALLPTTLKATLNDTNSTEKDITLTWSTSDTFNVKGGTYNYTAALSTDATDFTIDSGLTATAKITVNPVTVAANPTLSDVVKSVGSVDNTSHTTLGLTESGTVKDSKNHDVNYTITWNSPAASTVQTNTPNDVDFTGTIAYPSAPAYLTLPTSTTVTQKVSVKALPEATAFTTASQTAIDALTKSIDASDSTKDLASLKTAAALPTTAQVLVGGEAKDVTLTWADPTGTYDPKSGAYKFTATVAPKDSPATFTVPSTIKAEATITVNPVSIAANPTLADVTKVVGSVNNSSHTTLGLTMSGNAKDSKNADHAYTIAWTTAANTAKDEVGTYAFNGTITYTDAPVWLTVPTSNAVTQNVVVQDKPAASDFTTASKTAIAGLTKSVKASADTLTPAALKTAAALPATATVVVGSGEKTVNLTWGDLDAATYDPKSGTYKFETTAVTPGDDTFTVPSTLKAEATLTVEAVTVALPTLTDVNKTVGNVDNTDHSTLGLTTSGNAADNNSGTHAYTIEWTEAANTVATDAEGTYTFNGTVTYTDAPAWLTQPDNKAVTQKVIVTETPKEKATDLNQASKDAIKAVEDADPILASEAGNTADAMAATLPTELKVVDAAGKEYDVTAAWELDDAAYDKKGGEHKFKATLTPKTDDVDVSELTAPTATISVDPVKVTVPSSIFAAATIKRNTSNETFASLGVDETGKATLDPKVDGVEVNFTVAWTPESTTFDTSKSKNSATFEGTITLTPADVKDWMTLPTADELKGSKTLTVRSTSSGGGGGGGSSTVRATATPAPTVAPTEEPERPAQGDYIIPIGKDDKSEINNKTVYEASKELIDKAVEPAKSKNNSRAIIVGAADKGADYEYINIPAQDLKNAMKDGIDFEVRTGSGLRAFLPTTVADDITDDTEFVEVRVDKDEDGKYTIGFTSNDEDLKDDNRILANMAGDGNLNSYVPVIDGKPVKMSLPDGDGVKFLLDNNDYTFENRPQPFDDVDDDFWGEQFIDFLYARDMVNGVGDNMFEPHSEVTRAQFARMIVEAFGLEGGSDADLAQFTDIEDGAWYVDSLRTAANAGVIRGYEDSTIRPYSPITREEMTAMLARACDNAGMSFTGTPITFDDEADIADYAKANVANLTTGGIINGMGDGTFAPKNTTTRAEAATVITKVFTALAEDFLK